MYFIKKVFIILMMSSLLSHSSEKDCAVAFITGASAKMFERALRVYDNAYAPYSKFKVAAAVKTKEGIIYTGVNIENAAYTGVHAEQSALANMITDIGKAEIDRVVIVGKSCEKEGLCTPCGNCRQALSEFASPDTLVDIYDPKKGHQKSFTLGELLPHSFTLDK